MNDKTQKRFENVDRIRIRNGFKYLTGQLSSIISPPSELLNQDKSTFKHTGLKWALRSMQTKMCQPEFYQTTARQEAHLTGDWVFVALKKERIPGKILPIALPVSLCNRISNQSSDTTKMLLSKPFTITPSPCRTKFYTSSTPKRPSWIPIKSMVANRSVASQQRRTMSALEARISLVLALASQASSRSQQGKGFPFYIHDLMF